MLQLETSLLLCFGFCNVAADADPGAFIEAESRNAVAYRAGCRTFGWECLGNYACTGQPAGSLPFGPVHAYVIGGSDPAEAMRAAEEAPDPPGFAEVVAESRSFMTSQEDTAVARLRAAGDQPGQPTPLKGRCIVVRLHDGRRRPSTSVTPDGRGGSPCKGPPTPRRRRSACTAATIRTARMPAATGCSRRSSPAARRSRCLPSTGAPPTAPA
jgi:hypothetical protein